MMKYLRKYNEEYDYEEEYQEDIDDIVHNLRNLDKRLGLINIEMNGPYHRDAYTYRQIYYRGAPILWKSVKPHLLELKKCLGDDYIEFREAGYWKYYHSTNIWLTHELTEETELDVYIIGFAINYKCE